MIQRVALVKRRKTGAMDNQWNSTEELTSSMINLQGGPRQTLYTKKIPYSGDLYKNSLQSSNKFP